MASNKNTSNAGLFGQPLDGELLFDQLSGGPQLFMPIPVAPKPIEVKQPAPPPAALPSQNKPAAHIQQNIPSKAPDIQSSFPTSNTYNAPPQFFQPQMSAQDLVGPPTGKSFTPTSQLPSQQMQQPPPARNTYQKPYQPYQNPHILQSHAQTTIQPSHQVYQSQQIPNLPNTNSVQPPTQNIPLVTPTPPQQQPQPPLFTPSQAPPRPAQMIPPSTLLQENTINQPIVAPQMPQPSLKEVPLNQADGNVPPEFNISPLNGTTTAAPPTHQPSPLPLQKVTPHWFYHKGGKKWTPFSYYDSHNLEKVFLNPSLKRVICTDGGRFDVDLVKMTKTAVYWNEQPCEVRRCTWFYKGDTEGKVVPFDVTTAELLEKEFAAMMNKGVFNVRVDIAPSKFVVFHNPNVLVQYTSNLQNVAWSGEDAAFRPKVVKRGISDIQDEIERGETEQIDHLVFVVQGIGPVADLRMRSIIECVDDFRRISGNQIASHGLKFKEKPGNRVEFLPIPWHSCLRDDKYGIDRQLKALSLPSIGKLRHFTNETLTDILFFTSPIYCQTICDTVVGEMNRIYKLFKLRNPSYFGSVSVVGHSLGSCILFDILAHQVGENSEPYMYEDVGDVVDVSSTSIMPNKAPSSIELVPKTPSIGGEGNSPLPSIDELCYKLNLMTLLPMFQEEQIDTETIMMCSEADLRDLEIPFGPRKKILAYIHEQSSPKPSSSSSPTIQRSVSSTNQASTRGTQTPIPLGDSSASTNSVEFKYKTNNTGIGQPLVKYAKLDFQPSSLFCLGSPIGLFLTCRGIHSIGTEFTLPNCTSFMNIFHPYDPVTYRLEPLINEEIDLPPSLIPHHKGRKRFHLEIKENLSRAGAHLKHSIMDSVNRTWTSIKDFAKAHRSEEEAQQMEGAEASGVPVEGVESSSSSGENTLDSIEADAETLSKEQSLNFGKLNSGARVDYVLQENPFELINEYIFALSSHTCYWTSDDTALLIVTKIYNSLS